MTGKSRIGTILLLITVLIWGTGFSIGNIGMRYIPIYTYNGIKSIVAGLFLLIVIFIGKRRGEHTNPNRRRTMQGGIACGVHFLSQAVCKIMELHMDLWERQAL